MESISLLRNANVAAKDGESRGSTPDDSLVETGVVSISSDAGAFEDSNRGTRSAVSRTSA